MTRKIKSKVVKHIKRPLEKNDMNTNLSLSSLVLFYLAKLYPSGENVMTLEQLQADIKVINNLLDAINSFTPDNAIENQVIAFIKEADSSEILQNIMLLVINNIKLKAALAAKS